MTISRTDPFTVPVRVIGSVNEPASVTVNGQTAQVTTNPASTTGAVLFSAWASLAQGANSVAIQATDIGPSGANVTTKHADIYVAGADGLNKSYTYDYNGNCTGYTSSAGNVTYAWDGEDRLVTVTKGTHSSAFIYDGLSRCVQIAESTSGTVTATRRFVWSGTTRCEERDAANNVTKRFFPEGEEIAGTNYFFTFDELGSVQEVSDSAGTIISEYDYDSYGNQTNLYGTLNADFGFAGYYNHTNSGLYLTLYRAYDPDAGRWLNRDPLGDDGSLAIMTAGLLTKPDSGKVNALSDDEAFSLWSAINRNLYNFVDNNPVNEVDPLGLDPNTELAVAIARGDTEAIQSILDAVADDDVSAAMRKSAQDALNKLRSKAGDWISKQCKGGINREFPDQFRNDTLEDIKNAAKAGDKAAKKAWKLLNDSRFKK